MRLNSNVEITVLSAFPFYEQARGICPDLTVGGIHIPRLVAPYPWGETEMVAVLLSAATALHRNSPSTGVGCARMAKVETKHPSPFERFVFSALVDPHTHRTFSGTTEV